MVQAWVIPVLSVTQPRFPPATNRSRRALRTVTVIQQAASEAMMVTGHIEAEHEAALGFSDFRSGDRALSKRRRRGDGWTVVSQAEPA